MESMNYQFAAIRGIQAEREYFVVMCPLKLIPRIFLYDEEILPAELRAQRTLNSARIPDLSQYLVSNPKNYVFSAITVSVDGEIHFKAEGDDGYQRNIGMLHIPMTSRFIINDGQHRRAAIEEAIKENPDLGDETISVVLFIDAGLKRSQQMFADLNKHAVRPTKSLSILYDHRDPVSAFAVDLTNSVPLFKGLTEVEKTTISNRSTNLFTLNAISQSTKALLRKTKKGDTISEKEKKIAKAYWIELGKVIPEWRMVIKRDVSSVELRKNFVHSHGVALQALGEAGSELLERYPDDWKECLQKLQSIDWRRANSGLWEGRAMVNGRMSKARDNVNLTVGIIKQTMGLPLSEKQLELEERLALA